MTDEQVVLTAERHAQEMAGYIEAGRERALALGNRGPLKFTEDGEVAPDILEAYWSTGFYIFEGVVKQQEIGELRAGVKDMLERAPVEPGAALDAKGRPARRDELYHWMPALGDPLGGSDLAGGRHAVKMAEPVPPSSGPQQVITVMDSMCEGMDAGLRLYGHPQLLAIAQAVNGPDFVPFTDGVFIKQPGLGASISWHQDGVTHWDSPDWDEGSHGFNFQVQLYRCTPANSLWVIPSTHRTGKVGLVKLMQENDGSDRLPDAVPLFCEAGDVTIVNRQAVHGSFPNTSPDLRVSVTFGFHRRASVIGQRGSLIVSPDTIYDQERIRTRSRTIALAIDARAQHFPDEERFIYQPFAGEEEQCRWVDSARDEIRDYSRYDLAI